MIKVAIVQRRLAHYRLPLYEQIVHNHPDIALTLYCGWPDTETGGSGIPIEQDPDYVKRIRNYRLNIAGRFVLVQPTVFFDILCKRYDVVVYEASMMVWSSIMLLVVRRCLGNKNILWLKVWPHLASESNAVKRCKKTFLNKGDGYIVYGQSSKRSLISNFDIGEDRITIAQNTVDVQHLLALNGSPANGRPEHPAVESILRGKPPFIFNIGRLVEKKRVVDLLDAFGALTAENGFDNLRLVIAGDGPDRPHLQELASERRLTNVIFLGQVSETAMSRLFQSACCCVFPGAVGLALNQAMASARPVICADEPGPDAELLVDKLNGLRYERGNVREMVGAIKAVLSNPPFAHRLGEQARHTIRERATMENMAEKYVHALHKVLEK